MRTHIAICDDEAVQLEYLARLVAAWASARDVSISIDTFPSAEAFLFAFDEDKRCDILLLDVQMGGMDGMTLAEKVRAADGRLQIVFISAFSDFMARGYDVEAVNYLIKPVGEEKLFQVLDKAASKLETSVRTVVLAIDGGYVRIPAHDILYAEAFSHSVELHTPAQTHTLKITMNELEALLGEGFFRCHRSYIVNMFHVRRITRASVALDTGREMPLSRKLYDAANQAFIRLC